MPTSSSRGGPPVFAMPSLDRWMWRVLGGLLALYVVELVLTAAGLPIERLAWLPPGPLFGAWQPVTRFLVQGAGNVTGVLFGLIALMFFSLPSVGRSLSRRQFAEAIGAAAIVGTLLPIVAFGLDASGMLPGRFGALHGWWPLVIGTLTLFGLLHPGETMQLLVLVVFVPVPAILLVWGPAVVGGLLLLSGLATGASISGPLETLGVWAGTMGWWQWRGPAARRRDLKKQARGIERELKRLHVLPGGRGDRRDVH